MGKILITGGTGKIGKELTELLQKKGHDVYWLSRNSKSNQTYRWSLEDNYIDPKALENLYAVIHLAGANLFAKRWSNSYKKEIIDSRTLSIQLIDQKLKEMELTVPKLISASGVGYYGMINSIKPMSETDPPNNDFLSTVCIEWEKSVLETSQFNQKTILRIGAVLGQGFDAFEKLIQPIKWGVKVIPGNGEQLFPWISSSDAVRCFDFFIQNEQSGIFNLSGTEQLTIRELNDELANHLGKSGINFSVPGILMLMGLGEVANILLKGPEINNEKLLATGFELEHPTIKQFLKQLED